MDPHYNDIPVPEFQDKILSIVPIFPAILSVWGSSNIIYMVVTSKKRTPYRRILFGLSCGDLLGSLTLPLHGFLLPAETSPRVWAIGNEESCSALGFIHQLDFSTGWYSAMLSFYFLLTVKYSVGQEEMARKYEPFMHIFSIGYPLITACIGAGMGVYDEMSLGHGCWVTNYPKGCGCKEEGEEGNVCCTSPMIAWIFGGIPTMMFILAILINNLLVICHVRKTVRKSNRYGEMDYSAQCHNNDDGMDGGGRRWSMRTSANAFLRRSTDHRMDQRIKAVATQGFLYVAAFFVTLVPAVIIRILESQNFHDEEKLFPLLLLHAIFRPTQGFFNCFIYAKPTYVRIRKRFPDQSRLWALRRALHGERIEPRQSTLRSSVTRRKRSSKENTTMNHTGTGGGTTNHDDDDDDDDDVINNDNELATNRLGSVTKKPAGVVVPAAPKRVIPAMAAWASSDRESVDTFANEEPITTKALDATPPSWVRSNDDCDESVETFAEDEPIDEKPVTMNLQLDELHSQSTTVRLPSKSNVSSSEGEGGLVQDSADLTCTSTVFASGMMLCRSSSHSTTRARSSHSSRTKG